MWVTEENGEMEDCRGSKYTTKAASNPYEEYEDKAREGEIRV